MEILGISASRRKWGNTDILVHLTLEGAAREGAKTRFLRLTDYDICQCRGCLSCLFKDRDCIIKDGFIQVLDAMRRADGLVLGSPVYFLSTAGSLQVLLSRLFRQSYTAELARKPGIGLAVGGMPGWEGLALAQVAIFFLSLGMNPVDQFVGYGQGPGEIFYDTAACHRAVDDGKALARGETGFRGASGACPVCHFDLIAMGDDGRPRCVVCDVSGQWVVRGGVNRFKPLSGSKPRWGAGATRKHFDQLILPSGRRFLTRKGEIEQKLASLKQRMKMFNTDDEKAAAHGRSVRMRGGGEYERDL